MNQRAILTKKSGRKKTKKKPKIEMSARQVTNGKAVEMSNLNSPAVATAVGQTGETKSEWMSHLDPTSGKEYFVDKNTNRSTWTNHEGDWSKQKVRDSIVL